MLDRPLSFPKLARLAPVAIVALQLWLMWGLWWARDVNVRDEAHYLRQAWRLASGDIDGLAHEWSLPLVVLHAALLPIGLAPVAQIDVVTVVCALFATWALWWGLRAAIGVWPAFAAAAWWAATSEGLHFERVLGNSYTLGLGLGALVIGFVARGKPFVALPFVLLALLNRGEWSLCIALTGAAWFLASFRETLQSWRVPGLVYAALGSAFFIALQTSWRARRRSWWSFEQHYEWAHPDGRTAADVFPGAHSIVEAAQSEPTEFTAHVARNVARLPGEMARLVYDVAPWSEALQTVLSVALGAAVVAAVVQRKRGVAAVAYARGSNDDEVRVAARRDDDARDAQRADAPHALGAERTPLLLLFAALAPILVVNVVFMTRAPLLVPLAPVVLLATFALASRALARVRSPLVLAAPLVLAVIAVVLHPPFHERTPVLPQRAAVELLRAHASATDLVLGAHVAVLVDYAVGPRVARARTIDVLATDFAERHAGVPFSALVDDPNVTLLLDTPALAAHPGARAAIDTRVAAGLWHARATVAGATLLARSR